LVVTLHDVELALRYFPRIVALRDGRVVFDQAPAEVSRGALDALYAGNSEPEEALGDKGEAKHESYRERSCAR